MTRLMTFVLCLFFTVQADAAVISGGSTTTVECTAASYSALPAGQPDGKLCRETTYGGSFVYDSSTAVWYPADSEPVALIADYDGSVLPTAAVPAWTKGTGGAAVTEATDGSVLTITDSDAGSYLYYTLASVSLSTASNMGMLARIQIDASSADVQGWKFSFGFRPNPIAEVAVGVATEGLADVHNLAPHLASSGAPLFIAVNRSDGPDNRNYQWYLVTYHKDTKVYHIRVLGLPVEYGIPSVWSWDTNVSIADQTAVFGIGSTTSTVTAKVDRVIIYTF